MAYQKKYYTDIISAGHDWRLEIQQDSEATIQPRYIGAVLQGLRLYVQGDQADIDTPIVKTSLEMVFVDAPDLDAGTKCGNWEEFYTSNATEYKVLLYKDNILEWSGYITPDSFAEDLQYRGSVTIIARDNLGALQDYVFSAEDDGSGMVSVNRLIDAAKKAISFPMEIEWKSTGARRLPFSIHTDFEPFAYEILFNQSAFIGLNWWEILETVLYSTGLALRYVGGNKFMLSSLRDIPLYDFEYWADVPVKPATFLSYGHRELSPAVKTIKDVVTFEIVDNIAEVFMPAESYGEEGRYVRYIARDGDMDYHNEYALVHASVGGSWEQRTVDKSLFLNPFKFKWKEGKTSNKYGDLTDETAVYLATNVEDLLTERTASWEIELVAGTYGFSFTAGHPVSLYDDLTKIGFCDFDSRLSRIRFRLQFTSNDGTEKLEYRSSSNSWITNHVADVNSFYADAPFPYRFSFPDLAITKRGKLRLEITGLTVNITQMSQGVSQGAYVAIKDMRLIDAKASEQLVPSKLTTTTNYDKKNNIRLERSIAYGFTNAQIVSPRIVKNGMFLRDADDWYTNSDEWVFGTYAVPNPLPVLTHQQILAYYAKPNNVLTGELATPNPTFDALYEWRGTKHLLMSGALNILTGRMEGAVLREFCRYDQMWETWLEQDVIRVTYEAGRVVVLLHSNKALTVEDVQGIPNTWMYATMTATEGNTYELSLGYDWNYTNFDRIIELTIDGAVLKFIQPHYIYEGDL